MVHLGGALEEGMEEEAKKLSKENPRYQWMGEVSHKKALQILSTSHLHVITSKMEGGANALGEAISAGVPSLASRISGNEGILGDGYPGYFEVGDTKGLSLLLQRAEEDSAFYQILKEWTQKRSFLFDPEYERECWKRLLEEVVIY